MSEQGQTTDLIEHLRKKMMARAAEACSLQDSEVIRLSQLLDVHLVALMRPHHALEPVESARAERPLPPASGEGRRLDEVRLYLQRRRFRVLPSVVETTRWS
ncbi:aspartyl-phosphate phosphatase Spo0E family protein [Alicyclobacillus vulcanalis]|uniref:Spo0E like sporulation regulatory protein n=1 Tax=Alicyclobacillus vulcanalis TaxID=252246 RepID=A0A1N7KXA1_9BACL|nr:aspartyl-phosphate phosphatase Spo0E family protein [Alicyclobacillus vulcanalis]SIS66167.1 Spo0E like sporulation regulatory protein [Alicyclobacillus vulcanalis]